MAKNVVTINKSKDTQLDFNINIKGIPDEDIRNMSKVRFVIENVTNEYSLSFKCERKNIEQDNTTWYVSFPPLPQLDLVSYNFHIELIVDGYYFEPASGPLYVVTSPEIDIMSAKPTITITTNLQDSDEDVDQHHDTELSSKDSITNNSTLTSSNENTIQPITLATKTVDNIIKETIGIKIKPTGTKGFLFERSKDGKALVKGLEDLETQQRLTNSAAKVKDILKDK